MRRIFHGTIIHCTSDRKIEIHLDATMMVKGGVIQWLQRSCGLDLEGVTDMYGVSLHDPMLEIVRLADDEFMVPGFVDTHNVSLHWHYVMRLALIHSTHRPSIPWVSVVLSSPQRGITF